MNASRARYGLFCLVLPLASCMNAPRPCPAMPPPGGPAPGMMPPNGGQPAVEKEPLAVLPIRDDQLFRAERLRLRTKLAEELGARAQRYEILPLADVDAKLAAVSKSGARCAFQDGSQARRASWQGWSTTQITNVYGTEDTPAELWIGIDLNESENDRFVAPWDDNVDLAARYEGSFGALVDADEQLSGLGVLGGLMMADDCTSDGPMRFCISPGFEHVDTAPWRDKMKDASACYDPAADLADDVLVDASGATRCELANVDAPDDATKKRETCLCAALTTSAGMKSKPNRRVITVKHEPVDLVGKPRPELRVVEASTNVFGESDFHEVTGLPGADPKQPPISKTIKRLFVDNLDAAAGPLARCAAPAGTIALADLSLGETGAVTAAHVVSSGKGLSAECVEKALKSGAAFDCTDDGKSATLRIAIEWTAAKP